MSISWRPSPSDALTVYVSAFGKQGEPYTLDFGQNDVRLMYPKFRPAAKTYPAAGTYLVVARTMRTGITTHGEIVVRSHLTPRFSVEEVASRRVRLRIDHPGSSPVLHRVNWGDDGTWSDHGEDDLTLEFVYPRTETPPRITVMDVPALRSASKLAPVARHWHRHRDDEPPPRSNVTVEVNVNVGTP